MNCRHVVWDGFYLFRRGDRVGRWCGTVRHSSACGGLADPPAAEKCGFKADCVIVSVYVLWSEKLQKRYVGYSLNVPVRLRQHNTGSSAYTSRGIPWTLYYSERYSSNREARKRELFLKSGAGRLFLDRTFDKMPGYPEDELPTCCLGWFLFIPER